MPVDKSLMERLALALVRSAHVSIWAADRNHNIVLWNSGAERIYGRGEKDVLGKNYLELFVDEVERDESAIHCRRIIDTDYRQHNCLAYDKDASGNQVDMLTNCFRITDPDTGEHYQGEIGIDISDLQLRYKQHRELREVGRERLAIQKQTAELRRKNLFVGIDKVRVELMHDFASRKRELDKWLNDQTPAQRKIVAPTHKGRVAALKKEHEDDVTQLDEFKRRVENCQTESGLVALQAEWEDLTIRILAPQEES
jgi:PAS domain S-box-containing protein